VIRPIAANSTKAQDAPFSTRTPFEMHTMNYPGPAEYKVTDEAKMVSKGGKKGFSGFGSNSARKEFN
jgi:hypothetical protein